MPVGWRLVWPWDSMGMEPERKVSVKNPPSGWGIRDRAEIRSFILGGSGILL